MTTLLLPLSEVGGPVRELWGLFHKNPLFVKAEDLEKQSNIAYLCWARERILTDSSGNRVSYGAEFIFNYANKAEIFESKTPLLDIDGYLLAVRASEYSSSSKIWKIDFLDGKFFLTRSQ